jgi:hypothetical protein
MSTSAPTAPAGTKKPSPTARRLAWLAEVFAEVNEVAKDGRKATTTQWARAYFRIRDEGPAMGRSAGWREALAWLPAHQADGFAISWVVGQGSVHLNYAA